MSKVFKQVVKMCAMDIKYMMADFKFIITYHDNCYYYNYENFTFKPINKNSNRWFCLDDIVKQEAIDGLTKFINSICNNIRTCEEHGIKNNLTSFYTYEDRIVVIDFNEIEEYMNRLSTSEVSKTFLFGFGAIGSIELACADEFQNRE